VQCTKISWCLLFAFGQNFAIPFRRIHNSDLTEIEYKQNIRYRHKTTITINKNKIKMTTDQTQ